MHGSAVEERKRNRYMWTVSTRGESVVVADDSSLSSLSSSRLFSKDGREISVGDCALFKPPKESPPFIGIIRSLSFDKENKLKLSVNWLYRPFEAKLGKGILLEAAPNEIFYSFHKDEIPAASLIHPCKVAFLPKGVELSSGISSFVCRRVYDITNKCLWWLTDKDYINERQEEVDKLLLNTQIEMHPMLQSGVQSPKPTLVPSSTSQLKVGLDSVQNCTPTFPLQTKGRKRERADQGSEFVRQDCVVRTDDRNCANNKLENIIKSEISKITENGGLADAEGVEKMLQLMLSDGSGKKIGLAARSMLAGVIEATDKLECLTLFVQQRGLPVFDEWLQEVHKGKIGDSSSPKDTDRSVEEFLLILLRALDKLPVNLPALQMCNIGKSVNHLRTHKNFEIQKKARSLVDTWKKRVAAEMNINDAKSGSNQVVSWSTRQHLPEVPRGGNSHLGAISDVAVKSSATQRTIAKTTSAKLVHGEGTSPGFKKTVASRPSATTQLKDGQQRFIAVGDATEVSRTTARDDRSSSSSQSHNTGQSYSSEHSKSRGLAKEDARSSTAGSLSLNKISGVSTNPRKSTNGYPAAMAYGVQKEFGPGRRSSLHQNSSAERLSQSGLTCEKAPDFTVSGGSQNLRIKIPNQGCSPARSTSGGSFEDHSVMTSRASSPMLLENHRQFDCQSKEKIDFVQVHVTSDVNAESWQSNDIKDVAIASADGDGSPVSVHDGGNCRTSNGSEVVKAYSPSLAGENKIGSLPEASFNSLNALIESCVKQSEADASTFVADDVGMKLLASVAIGEMSQSDVVLTTSPQRIAPVDDCSHMGADLKEPPPGVTSKDRIQSNRDVDDGHVINIRPDSGEGKTLQPENDPAGEHLNSLHEKSKGKVVVTPESTVKMSGVIADTPKSMLGTGTDGQGVKTLLKKSTDDVDRNNLLDCTPESSSRSSSGVQVHNVVLSQEVEMQAIDVSIAAQNSMEGDNENHNHMYESLIHVGIAEKASKIMHSDSVEKKNDDVSVKDFSLDTANETMIENDDQMSSRTLLQPERQIDDAKTTACEYPMSVGMETDAASEDNEFVEEKLESKDLRGRHSEQVNREMPPACRVEEREQHVGLEESRLPGTEADKTSSSSSTIAAALLSVAGGSDIDAKVKFDLNERLDVDDGKCGESSIWFEPECSTGVKIISPLPVPSSSVSNCLPASITVTAAAKGSFVPLDDLLRNKGEIGWKGSAVTSAFRPAEPRKVPEMPPHNNTNISFADATATINSRPCLDFDLNVPDERILEEINHEKEFHRSSFVCHSIVNHDSNHDLDSASVCRSGGLDLDLNQVDEAVDVSNCLTSNVSRKDVSLPADKPYSISNNGCPRFQRDFDLNGPIVEEVSVAPSLFNQQGRCSIPSQPSPPGPWMNNPELRNFPTWFPPGNTYSTVTIPSLMSDRSEQMFPIASSKPQRMLSPTFTNNSFSPDVSRGPILSSSPAVPFPPAPFQYHFFPFGTSFPLPSGSFSSGSTSYVDSSSGGRFCFSAVPPQLFGPAGTVSTHYPRPYVVSFPDGSIGSGESSHKWGKQCLDLNAGPGGLDTERRDETLFFGQKQLSAATSLVQAEDHMRIYQPAHGILKRKEPEGGWDGYQQPSRQ